jgi:hypothetical protein
VSFRRQDREVSKTSAECCRCDSCFGQRDRQEPLPPPSAPTRRPTGGQARVGQAQDAATAVLFHDRAKLAGMIGEPIKTARSNGLCDRDSYALRRDQMLLGLRTSLKYFTGVYSPFHAPLWPVPYLLVRVTLYNPSFSLLLSYSLCICTLAS